MRRVIMAVAVGALVLGCEPTDVPRLSADGKSIAVLLKDAEQEPLGIVILSVEDGSAQPVTPPEGWTPFGLIWIEGRLLVQASRKTEAPKGRATSVPGGRKEAVEQVVFVCDPSRDAWTRTTVPCHMSLAPLVSSFKGRPCILAPDMSAKRTRAFSLENLKEVGSVEGELDHAGGGWAVREVWGSRTRPLIEGEHTGWIAESIPEDKRTVTREELLRVEVLNGDGRVVGTVPRAEVAKACHRGPRKHKCARISPDRSKLLLGFGTDTAFRRHSHEYTFGVFDSTTGRHLWGGSSNNLHGVPYLADDAAYAIEAKERKVYTGDRTAAALFEGPAPTSQPTRHVVLARHTKEGRTVVIDVDLGEGNAAKLHSFSEDGKRVTLQVEGRRPRIVLIPVAEKVRQEDLVELALP